MKQEKFDIIFTFFYQSKLFTEILSFPFNFLTRKYGASGGVNFLSLNFTLQPWVMKLPCVLKKHFKWKSNNEAPKLTKQIQNCIKSKNPQRMILPRWHSYFSHLSYMVFAKIFSGRKCLMLKLLWKDGKFSGIFHRTVAVRKRCLTMLSAQN